MSDSATIGHNSLVPFKKRVDDLVDGANKWLAAVPVVQTDEQATRLDDFIKQADAEFKACEAERKAINKPFDDAIAANNDLWRPLATALKTINDLLKPKRTAWLQLMQKRRDDETARKAAEAAALQKAAEEAAKKAESAGTVQDVMAAQEAAKKAEAANEAVNQAVNTKATVKGDYAQRSSSLRTFWSATITDFDRALEHYKADPKVRDAVQSLADADARKFKAALNVPGVAAKSEEKAV